MAEFHFTATGYIDEQQQIDFMLRWEDETLTGTQFARELVADFIREPKNMVSVANMVFSGSELIAHAYACKRMIGLLFYGVTFHDENMPPIEPVPPGAEA